ncbi:MAG TPA: M13-type metalloendopeptidase, partial [Allosphingosinicella sp.]|nr:M13-type metalloendopeptidase [Allosphingosinicella sp.]
MNKSLAFAASLLALAAAAPALAHEPHECLNEDCTIQSLIAPAQQGGKATEASIDPSKEVHYGTWGFDVAGMDRNVKPGDDWFRFVNGTWAAHTTIPADRTSWGGFAILRDISEARIRKLLEGYSPADAAHPDRAKAAILYRTFMDQAGIERADAAPLLQRLAPIRAARSRDDMARIMGESVGGFGGSFFGPGVSDDAKQPDIYSLYLRQGGLGLGDRDQYLDPKFRPQVERYRAYVAQMLGMAGWADPDKAAANVVALETRLAEAHWSRAQNRDRDKTYNLMTLKELQEKAPGFPWATWWQAAGIGKAERAIVAQNTAFPKIAAVFAETDVDTLKAWEAFRMSDELAPMLSNRFVEARFAFRNRFMNGQSEQQPRWKRGVSFAENAIGEGIGRDYVATYFPPESKAKMDVLVGNLRTALAGRIRNLAWMGPETKQQALAKLSHFNVKIGYPDKWRDYGAFQAVPGDLVGNAERASRFEWNYRRNRMGNPVDKAEWGMTPQTVNAYYNSVKNEIVFPAAILQPPFFDPKADMAVNYGGIGGVIGHEISHGFDDQGRKSDGEGRLRDWWTKEDGQKFDAQAAKLGAQY